MRYLLLSTTMIVASVTLPFVDMSKSEKGQPVEPVEVVTLGPLPADPPPATPPTADTGGLVLAQRMPELSGIGAAGFVPLDAMARFFRSAATAGAPQSDVEVARLAPAVPVPMASALPGRIPVAPDSPAPEFSMPGIVMPELDFTETPDPVGLTPPVMAAPDLAQLDLPKLDVMPGALGMASLLPLDGIAALFRTDPAEVGDSPDGSDFVASIVGGIVDSVTAPVEADPMPGTRNVAFDPIGPVTEVVGSLTLNTPTPVSLRMISRADPTPQPRTTERSVDRVETASERAVSQVGTTPPRAVAGVEETPATTSDARIIEVTANLLNLRAGPSSTHSVVIGLSRGARAEVIETADNGWVRIKLPRSGRTGWAFGAYLADTDGV